MEILLLGVAVFFLISKVFQDGENAATGAAIAVGVVSVLAVGSLFVSAATDVFGTGNYWMLYVVAAILAFFAIRQIFFLRTRRDEVLHLFVDSQAAPYSFSSRADVVVEETPPASVEPAPRVGLRERTVIALWLLYRSRSDLIAVTCLACAIAAHFVLMGFTNVDSKQSTALLVAALACMIAVNRAVCMYRVRKGYFGSNETEARELLRFLLDHAEESDFSGGMGLRDRVPEDLRAAEVVGVLEAIRSARA
jgi:hypothetical protein